MNIQKHQKHNSNNQQQIINKANQTKDQRQNVMFYYDNLYQPRIMENMHVQNQIQIQKQNQINSVQINQIKNQQNNNFKYQLNELNAHNQDNAKDLIFNINIQQNIQFSPQQQSQYKKYKILFEAFQEGDIDKLDIQRLFELCKEIEDNTISYDQVSQIILQKNDQENYCISGLEFIHKLMTIENDELLRKLSTYLICLLCSLQFNFSNKMCEYFEFTPISTNKIQLNQMPINIIEDIEKNPLLLNKIKTTNYILQQKYFYIWTYPQYQKSQKSFVKNKDQHFIKIQKEQDDNDLDSSSYFNEFDIDERVNQDIIQFQKQFPDPLYYCIGIIPQLCQQQNSQNQSKNGILKVITSSTMSGGSPNQSSDIKSNKIQIQATKFTVENEQAQRKPNEYNKFINDTILENQIQLNQKNHKLVIKTPEKQTFYHQDMISELKQPSARAHTSNNKQKQTFLQRYRNSNQQDEGQEEDKNEKKYNISKGKTNSRKQSPIKQMNLQESFDLIKMPQQTLRNKKESKQISQGKKRINNKDYMTLNNYKTGTNSIRQSKMNQSNDQKSISSPSQQKNNSDTNQKNYMSVNLVSNKQKKSNTYKSFLQINKKRNNKGSFQQ